MSTAGISFGGLASGLDTKAIISALVAIEERPIRAMETKKKDYTKQKSLYGDLKGLLDKLSTAAKALKTTTDFLQRKAASDDESVLTATAGSTATPGTYSVRVTDLAKAQMNASTGSASATTSLGNTAATIEITIGGTPHYIDVGANATMQGIADAINAYDDDPNHDMGVRAEVVDTGDTANGGANRYQLVVRSTKVGATNSFTIAVDDTGGATFDSLISNVAANRRTQASDATLVLNSTGGAGGITVYRASNQISDLFPGLTLDLKSVPNPPKDITITVSNDAEATTKKVQDFVDAYNKVVDFFGEQSALDAEGKAKGPLFGDSTLRSMRSNLRTVVGSSVTGTGNQAYQLLSQLGVTADKAGKLTLNTGKFEEALVDDEDAVAAVFTHATNGIAGRLFDQIDVYTDSVDGLIKNKQESFDRQVRDTETRITQAERRLTLYEKQLEAKYANLESLLSKLQSQGSSVGNINSFRR